jgi:hypothetical protein
MKKTEAYQQARLFGGDAAFLATIILTDHSKPARKLSGLVELLKSGHQCRTGQYRKDLLVIDGRKFGWEVLESPAVVDLWMPTAEME